MKTKQAFTLIELLMVISIIGVLAGILIPTVGAVRKQANIAASKSQLSNYVTAMTVFKSEYGYFPLATGTADSKEIKLDDDIYNVSQGDIVPIYDGVFHKVFNNTDEDLYFVCVYNGKRRS